METAGDNSAGTPLEGPRPYPWRCAECGQKAVNPSTIDMATWVRCEGAKIEVLCQDVPAHKCANCGSESVDEESDNYIRAYFRDHPERIAHGQILALLRYSVNQPHFTRDQTLKMVEQSIANIRRSATAGGDYITLHNLKGTDREIAERIVDGGDASDAEEETGSA